MADSTRASVAVREESSPPPAPTSESSTSEPSGLPRSRARKRRRRLRKPASQRVEPVRVGGIVGQVLERLGLSDRVERAAAAADWERIVGPHIARVTGERRVHGHTLFVEVEGAVWLTELNMMRHQFLRRLNAGRKRGRIEKIVFIQSGGRDTGGSGLSQGTGSGRWRRRQGK